MPDPQQRQTDASRAPRWALLRTAPDQLTAELWRGLLEEEGIPATLAPGDVVSFLGVSAAPCRLLVPEHLLEPAELALSGELWAAEAPE